MTDQRQLPPADGPLNDLLKGTLVQSSCGFRRSVSYVAQTKIKNREKRKAHQSIPV